MLLACLYGNGLTDAKCWLALEFASPDRTRGWATRIHMRQVASDPCEFRPRGLDAGKTYAVTLDNQRRQESFTGSRLMRQGLAVQTGAEVSSELLLFQA